MTTNKTKPRLTSLAPQFLVDDLARSIAYYEKLGFTFGDPWDGFYAIGQLDGLELHLRRLEMPRYKLFADYFQFYLQDEHAGKQSGVVGTDALG